jgi:hypothetical protein
MCPQVTYHQLESINVKKKGFGHEALTAKLDRSPVPNFVLDLNTKNERNDLCDLDMAAPSRSPRNNRHSDQWCWYDSFLSKASQAVDQIRPLQSFKHRDSGGLPLPSDKNRGI